MTNHTSRTATAAARKLAKAAGYYIREGQYLSTSDNRLGRWYIGHVDENGFRPWGSGYATQREAWESAAEMARERAETMARDAADV